MISLLSFNFTSFFFLFLFMFGSSSARTVSFSSFSSSAFQINRSIAEFQGHSAISDFRLLNRRSLVNCDDPNPYLQININSVAGSGLLNEQYVTVTVSGVLVPADSDWVAMISPSYSNGTDCPLNEAMYLQTGDTSNLPLLCHYPVKAQYVKNDPNYLGCNNVVCQEHLGDICVMKTCSGSLTFHVINIRTDIEFVFFTGGFDTPCILKRTSPVSFATPNTPLYGHLSSVDSTAQSMRLTWVSGDQNPQQVQFGIGNSQTSQVTTFTQNDMCSTVTPSPAKDFGWHDPGYIHTALMTGLQPLTTYSYRYGSDSVGWSDQIQFWTPPEGGSTELRFLAFGDMGKAPHDASVEHYIQPGSISVTDAIAQEVASGNVNSIFHIGDISYATGFLVEWDFFLQQIVPLASHVSYMTAIGNHERDYIDSGSVYITSDSGGECGVAYEIYFPMPTIAKDKPWYSIEQGPVHFTVISTEHDWTSNSEQYQWMEMDMASVNRSRTPWLIFNGHRPMYSSVSGVLPSVDPFFVAAVEPLLIDYKVDLALWGHVHNYERTCAVYQNNCKAMPTKDANGTDTFDNTNYSAPVHAVIGMAGFTLDQFPSNATAASWSLVRIAEFGYVRFQATTQELSAEFVSASTTMVEDRFHIIKS
ncbi:probable inactive purple acid phosphatase 27 [Telopea speciosissima]|uniref:probable inactive purple acid phosphatase 27 n=1 Tax=Telopea speciosissima TaxID=54955 RepID=UPI001CC470ED|nr:probable inactive purple acid phosphatase 27 [Telopea speciosissima]